MRPYLALCFFLLFANTLSGQTWQPVGPNEADQPFPGEPVASNTPSSHIAVYNGTAYAVGNNYLNQGKIEVKKYQGNTWQQIGIPGFSSSGVTVTSIAIDNTGVPYVAWCETSSNATLKVFKFDGSNWVQAGANIATTPTNLKLQFDGTNVLHMMYTNGNVIVKKFNGTSWIDEGTSGITSNSAGYADMAIDGSNVIYLAARGSTSTVVVKKFSAGTWSSLTTISPITSPNQVRIAIGSGDIPYVSAQTSNYIACYKKNAGASTVFTSILPAGDMTGMGSDLAVDNAGTPYISFIDANNSNGISIKKFDGTSWVNASPVLSSNIPTTSVYAGTELVVDGTTPYVCYPKANIRIAKWDGTAWDYLGISSGIYSDVTYNNKTYCSAIDANGDPIIAFQSFVQKYVGGNPVSMPSMLGLNQTGSIMRKDDISNDLYVFYTQFGYGTVQKFDGTSWSYVGNQNLTGDDVNVISMTVKGGTPYIIFNDASAYEKTNVMKFNGSAWVYVGNPAGLQLGSSSGSSGNAIAVNNNGEIYAAITGENNDKATVKKFTGGAWQTIGSNLSIGDALDLKLAINNLGDVFIAYSDVADYKKIHVQKYDGTSWTSVGSAVTPITPGGRQPEMKISLSDTIYVAYADLNNNSRATVKKFDGSQWVTVGGQAVSEANVYYGGQGTPILLNISQSKLYCFYVAGCLYGKSIDIPPAPPLSPPILSSTMLCRGGGVSINVIASGTYNAGNVFTAQLSSATGSFASPFTIGTLASTTGGTINATIASGQATGTGYRIRIVSSNPVFTGPDNGADLTVSALPTAAQATVTVTGSLSICPGGSVDLSVPSTAGLNYQWYENGTAIPAATANTYTAIDAGSYYCTVTNAGSCSRSSATKTVTLLSNPTATITPGNVQNLCPGQTVNLTANTGTGLTYQWYSNGNIIPGATASSYTAAPTAMYSVTVTNASGCSASSSQVEVNASGCAPIITSVSTYTLCRGASVDVSFNANGTFNAGNIFTAQLSSATGSFASPVNIGTLVSTTSGMINTTIPTAQASGMGYRIRIISSNPAMTGLDNGTNLTVSSIPTAAQIAISAAGALSFCQGGSVLLSVPSTAGMSYQWFKNNVAIPAATSNSYTAASSGNYYCDVTNVAGCDRSSAIKTVSVNPAPAATTNPAGPQTLCTGQTLTLHANTGAGLTYQWLNNGNPIPGQTASSYIVSANGSYAVKVTSSAGCTATSSPVVVSPGSCTPPSVSLATTTLCRGGAVDINYNANGTYNAGNVFTAQLSNGSGSFASPVNIGTDTSNGNGVIHATISSSQALGSGYRIRIISSSPALTGADNGVNLTMLAAPTAAQTIISASGPLSFCPGGSVVFSVPATAGFSYQWYLEDGTPVAGATANSYTASEPGAYYCNVSNTAGCSRASGIKHAGYKLQPGAGVSPSSPQTICTGQTVILSADTGTGNSYQWSNNATAIPGATSSSYTASATGNYTVLVTGLNGCTNTSAAVTVTLGSCGAAITDNGILQVCSMGGNVTVNYDASGFNAGNIFTLQLSNSSGSFSSPQNIGTVAATASGTITGIIPSGTPTGNGYKLRIISSNPGTTGPVSALTLAISGSSPDYVELCAVSVDAGTGKNLLIWNKPVSSNIDSFIIYRRYAPASGGYRDDRVGAQPYSAYSTFIDMSSQPAVQAESYIVKSKNICGEAGYKVHKTIHLSISQGQDANTWNLIWNAYEGFMHYGYSIWRGTTPTNMSVLTTVYAYEFNSYTDLNAPSGNVYYMITVTGPPACNPTARTTGGFMVSSNIATNDIQTDNTSLELFPNPSTSSSMLLIKSTATGQFEVRVMDIAGRVIELHNASAGKAVSFGEKLTPGVYSVEVKGNGSRVIKKWVKQ